MDKVSVSHAVFCNGSNVEVNLQGFVKTDMYATNLELTGFANWFGSANMCNLIADNATILFGQREENSSGCNLLELGSGLGRAGLMAMKIMELQDSLVAHCVLTDGEHEIVSLLKHNHTLNFPLIQNHLNLNNTQVAGICQQLWWGENAELGKLRVRYPRGFDIIIGCDIIYGPDSVLRLIDLLYTVNSLLSFKNRRLLTDIPTKLVSRDDSPTQVNSDFNITKNPAFYLAVTRRELLSVEELEILANNVGLTVKFLDEYTYGIFDNIVDTSSVFWRDAILRITRME